MSRILRGRARPRGERKEVVPSESTLMSEGARSGSSESKQSPAVLIFRSPPGVSEGGSGRSFRIAVPAPATLPSRGGRQSNPTSRSQTSPPVAPRLYGNRRFDRSDAQGTCKIPERPSAENFVLRSGPVGSTVGGNVVARYWMSPNTKGAPRTFGRASGRKGPGSGSGRGES